MNFCRICLSASAYKDIRELKTGKTGDSKSFSEILLFCLDIQVTEETKTTTKLCHKCFGKILSYHKFKTLALQNDTHLKSLINVDSTVKLEKADVPFGNVESPIMIINNDTEFSENNFPVYKVKDNNDFPCQNVKNESLIKTEHEAHDDQFDDELLSVVKKTKHEDSLIVRKIVEIEDSSLIKGEDQLILNIIPINEGLIKVRKRGRPKQKKSVKAKRQICQECGKSVVNIKQHTLRHIPIQDRKLFKCKTCDKEFRTHGACNKHNQSKHLGIRHRCEICGKEVVSLAAHMLRVHNPEKLKFPCIVCHRRFISQSMLDIHMLGHTKDKPYECDLCQKKFLLKVTMLHHRRQVHDQEKSHLCQFCSKTFFKKYHLQVHIRSHTKEKPYKCEECGRSFGSCTYYKNHKLTHSTEKNYQCDHCDMKFVRREYLRSHLISHSKEKRYPCKYCGVRFGRSDHRKRHQYTAHEKFVLPAA